MNIPETYNQLDQWTTVMFLYNSALKAINTKIEILNNEFIHLYNYNPIEHIKSRLKTPESIVKKLKRGGHEVTIPNMIEHLSDIAGIRIICSFSPDIYRIAEMIARQSDVTVLVVKDYIKNPKPNGYKSYHMVVTIPIYLSDGPVDTKVEIQIRTIAMDFWASLEHKIYYKFEGNAPDYLEQELKACADMADNRRRRRKLRKWRRKRRKQSGRMCPRGTSRSRKTGNGAGKLRPGTGKKPESKRRRK